jgi:hypothetical protein
MKKTLVVIAAVWSCAALAAPPGPPPPGGGRHVAPPGAWGGGYRPFYPGYRPGYRPVYPGWRPAYWGPRAGVYVAAPAYWGAWPYAWGAAYAVPYAVTPWVVAASPAPQVVVQQPVVAEVPASYWYYCAQPAGYYPYVQNCSQPWMKVLPQAPGGSTGSAPQLAP